MTNRIETIPAVPAESAIGKQLPQVGGHTPGPWALGEFNEHLGYDCMTAGVRCGPAVLDGNDYGQSACTDMEPAARAKMMADARLIAAAPELLEALQKCAEVLGERPAPDCYFPSHDPGYAAYSSALKAIAKATGQP